MRNIFATFCAFALAFLFSVAASAQVSPETAQKLRDYMKMQAEVGQLFKDKKYEEVVAKCDEMIALVGGPADPYYNKACALARLGKKPEALDALKLSVDHGFNDAEHMKQDDDLESLRAEKGFEEAVKKAEEVSRKLNGGGEMPGVKTVEGAPENGLPFRVRMSPTATKDKPNRLIIWLHPSGGSMNPVVEALAPKFIEKGFALLVITRKGWIGWNDADVEKLTGATLPAVEKIEGIDAKKPVLLGFSAGGQVALLLWQQDPSRWGALVLDAAYPITRGANGAVQAGMKLPEGEAAKEVPIYVLVGDKDGGSGVWKQVAPQWANAGVHVRVEYVPNGRHQWLVGPEQLKPLLEWLGDVAAGKMPENPVLAPADPNKKPAPPELGT